MTTDVTSRSFFNAKYSNSEDPWEFATSAYELEKYESTLRALSHRRYGAAFEPGCSVGVLTERLAPLCERLYSIDISDVAVERARQRCEHLPNAVIGQGGLPGDIPHATLDLVVFSEIGYYFNANELASVASQLVGRLEDCGVLLAVHWLGDSEDHLLGGDYVHEILHTTPGIKHELSERYDAYRLDRWVRA